MLSDEQTHSVLWDHSLIPIGPGVGQGEHRPPEGILDTRGFSPLATCSRVFSPSDEPLNLGPASSYMTP